MRLDEFSYDLPEKLIAQHPLPDREQAKLLIADRSGRRLTHEIFSQLPQQLPERSVLVLNNSRVIPARLLGIKERSGGRVELLLLKRRADGFSYEVMMRPTRKIVNGERIRFDGSSLVATVTDKERRIVRFNRKNVVRYLERIGHIPLPPYIHRRDTVEDRTDYQTVYARYAGSVAAPTAGLHFTRPLLRRLKDAGHTICQVTLHVNHATFKPVEEEDITRHRMHTERYSLSARTWEFLNQAKKEGRSVIAVGTTSCRVLESVAAGGRLRGDTDLFIYPGYRFKMVDALITNFHLPYSSLLMLVYAFGSPVLMKKAYAQAIRRQYRFFSYGDAMLIR